MPLTAALRQNSDVMVTVRDAVFRTHAYSLATTLEQKEAFLRE
jgi:hypothetical protein